MRKQSAQIQASDTSCLLRCRRDVYSGRFSAQGLALAFYDIHARMRLCGVNIPHAVSCWHQVQIRRAVHEPAAMLLRSISMNSQRDPCCRCRSTGRQPFAWRRAFRLRASQSETTPAVAAPTAPSTSRRGHQAPAAASPPDPAVVRLREHQSAAARQTYPDECRTLIALSRYGVLRCVQCSTLWFRVGSWCLWPHPPDNSAKTQHAVSSRGQHRIPLWLHCRLR